MIYGGFLRILVGLTAEGLSAPLVARTPKMMTNSAATVEGRQMQIVGVEMTCPAKFIDIVDLQRSVMQGDEEVVTKSLHDAVDVNRSQSASVRYFKLDKRKFKMIGISEPN